MVVLFWLVLWDIFFLPALGFELGTSGCLILHSTTPALQLLLFTSDNFRYLTLVQRDWWWCWSDWTCDRFSFFCTGVWSGDLWISSPALYHCFMATSHFHLWQFQVFNSRPEDWWWYCSDWACERCSFTHSRVWTDDLWVFSPTLYHCTMTTSGFHLWHFQVFNSGAEGLVVVLFWLHLWQIFFYPH